MKYFIRKVRKDDEGDIIAVKTRSEKVFSTQQVVQMIEGKRDIFVVEIRNTEVYVGVVKGENKKFIRTHKDGKWTNNLDELPEF